MTLIETTLASLKKASKHMRIVSRDKKNHALIELADRLSEQADVILSANKEDVENLPKDTTSAFRDRLILNHERIEAMVTSLRKVAALPDPVGEVVDEQTLENGLRIRKVRAPFGVVMLIFESRPNVILEAFSLAFKSGNAILLRGGSDSAASASAIYKLMRETLAACGFHEMPFYGIEDYDRKLVESLLKRKDAIDVIIPRGGDKLIEFVQKNAAMPIIKNDRGMCHTFVAADANVDMAVRIVTNAKTQRPGVCNALETVLVHEKVAKNFLPALYDATAKFNLEWHVDGATLEILKGKERVRATKPEHWDTEYLDFIINCKVVKSLEEALAHIERHGSRHSEAIVTQSESKARMFQMEVDAAAVYWNASTRFTDGFEFGLGGELGISTQKLHVRGPVGLRELTTPRWIIDGDGQVRR